MSTRWFPDLWSNLENQSLKEKTSCTVWMSPYLNLLICKYLLTYWRSRINSFLLLLLTTPNRMVTWASDWLTSITRGKQFYDLFWNKTWFFQSKLVVFMCLKSFWPKPVCVQLLVILEWLSLCSISQKEIKIDGRNCQNDLQFVHFLWHPAPFLIVFCQIFFRDCGCEIEVIAELLWILEVC